MHQVTLKKIKQRKKDKTQKPAETSIFKSVNVQREKQESNKENKTVYYTWCSKVRATQKQTELP